jgi:hypothetical protein
MLIGCLSCCNLLVFYAHTYEQEWAMESFRTHIHAQLMGCRINIMKAVAMAFYFFLSILQGIDA